MYSSFADFSYFFAMQQICDMVQGNGFNYYQGLTKHLISQLESLDFERSGLVYFVRLGNLCFKNQPHNDREIIKKELGNLASLFDPIYTGPDLPAYQDCVKELLDLTLVVHRPLRDDEIIEVAQRFTLITISRLKKQTRSSPTCTTTNNIKVIIKSIGTLHQYTGDLDSRVARQL